jgi:hypothetical protein
MKSFRILLISMVLSLFGGLAMPGFAQDEGSACLGIAPESTRPNLLFLLDNSGSMKQSIRDANGNSTGQTRIDALREALLTMLENTHNVNVGLGRFAALTKRKPEPHPEVNVPIMFPVSYIDGKVNSEIDDSIIDMSVSIAQSADDAEQNLGTGEMLLTDPKLQLVKVSTDEEPNGFKVEKSIATNSDDAVEWLGDYKKNKFAYFNQILYLGTDPVSNAIRNKGDSLIGLRFEKLGIPKGATIEFAEVEFVSDQEYEGELQINIYGAANDGVRPTNMVTGDPSGIYLGSSKFLNDAGNKYGYLSGEGYTTENFPKPNPPTVWDEFPPKVVANEVFNTPDISNIIQAIVNQDGWLDDNGLVLLFERSSNSPVNTRGFYSYEGRANGNPPLLRVYWTLQNSVELPSNNAGPTEENDKQIVGLRFEKVDIPNGAEVVSAHIEFTSSDDAADPTTLVIKAEDVDDAKSFTKKLNNISDRSTTSNQIYWNPQPWENGVTYKTPDISAVVQEVVDRDGWCGGRGGLAFIISGASEEPLRIARSYDNHPTGSAVLKVEFDSKKINGNGCVNQNFSGQIQADSDDAEEKLSGSEAGNVYLTSNGLELASRGSEARLVGFRFQDIPVSSTAKILSAHLVLNARSDKKGTASFKIYGEKSPNPDTFTKNTSNLSMRPKTSTRVTWSLEEAWKGNQIYKSPDISQVIQEIIKQEDWETYNNMALFIDGIGRRDVFSFEASPKASATLQIQVEGYLGEGGEVDLMTVRRWLKKTVRKMEIPNSLTPIVDALYEATQYYRGEAVEFGRTRHGEYLYLISHPGTIDGYTEGMISRAEECRINVNPFAEVCASEEYTVAVNYASPIKSRYQTNHIVLLSDGIATRHTSLELVQSLIGKTNCITSYEDPDDPTKTIEVDPDFEMCGIDLADFLMANDQVNKQPGTENTITLHTIGFQLGKVWRKIYVDTSNNRRVYKIDGINYYDEAGEEPIPEGTKLKIDGDEEDVERTATNARAVKFLQRLASVNTSDGTRNFYPADTVDDLIKTFEIITAGYSPHLNITTIGNGMVDGCGINCGEDCSEFYATNGDDYPVTLTATPDKGSIFVGWSGDCSGTTNPLTVNMNGPLACVATFVDTFSSKACQLYGVQDDGLNDTQFFTVNPETFVVNALGESLPGYDIEALDVHPNTGILYAASGDNTDNPGHLYTVNTQTGALNDLGYTGFDEIEGLSFQADTLWAWAKGDGLISINPQNGVTGALVFPSPVQVEDLTWNNEGTRLYAVQDTTLWVSDGQSIEQSCDLPGHTEAIEMLPNNFLLLGIHGNRNILNFKIMDLATCVLLPGAGVPTNYNDVEGIAWPANKACGGGSTVIDEELGKSMVSEALMLSFGIKMVAETFYQEESRWPTALELEALGAVTEGTYVKGVYTYDATHPQIVMTIDKFESGANQISWKMIDRVWSCKASENGSLTTIPSQYLPISCQ